jgi:hypothetical protein
MSSPFNEKLYAKLSTIFGKTIGQNLDIRQIDQINMEVKQLAEIIAEFVDARAQVKALEIVKKLQEVAVKGFETMDAQVADLEARIAAVEERTS